MMERPSLKYLILRNKVSKTITLEVRWSNLIKYSNRTRRLEAPMKRVFLENFFRKTFKKTIIIKDKFLVQKKLPVLKMSVMMVQK